MKPSRAMSLLSNPIAFYPGLVPVLGSIKATLFFCQIYYWRDKTNHPDGVFKSVQEISNETHLTYKEQISVRKHLCSLGVITETYDRLNHRVFFLVNKDALDELMYQRDLQEEQEAHDKKEDGTLPNVMYHLTKGNLANTETTAKTTTKPRKRVSSAKTTLSEYLEQCKAEGTKPIPDDHCSRQYARDAGISPEMIALAWFSFLDNYRDGTGKAKKYVDWGLVFNNAVKGNWAKLWYVARDSGTVNWTSEGLLYKATIDAKLGDKK